ncbi:hypothetical protein N6H18_08395 [Reichenbachiella agarivorans]|uniref:Uncharacterized protein n=1 Tax=Reichenbachiella agarivorans TaxID=2979464 RepID=A0ABY6CTZ2_9BACT|nr:hypothetical protein [Reichenbachiella agarivorans]UXP33963.1 hypothetical protein N6H18_08395 [Reichenbachiella agarivorans]
MGNHEIAVKKEDIPKQYLREISKHFDHLKLKYCILSRENISIYFDQDQKDFLVLSLWSGKILNKLESLLSSSLSPNIRHQISKNHTGCSIVSIYHSITNPKATYYILFRRQSILMRAIYDKTGNLVSEKKIS